MTSMTDEEILAVLRAKKGRLTPTELAERLDQLTGGKLSHSYIVTFFKRAFPEIPLRVLLEAGVWGRVCGGKGESDAEFNERLRPWLGP
ncbi:hypothetical protein JY651_17170 [Pyxidicoccus parkwayensis]|uniref:Uncharacterized protein n=1 Tax=Pyxidicoccus parkwayensis TaxID=2813578 RepID=A0ABX7P7T9_9BACT|nr:hypothetical protein [Pyxidicoccus parkwaysis]QSQ26554.1 hypothetical protein JY651_17170 [Pyxidicoccus parkwaysis]